MNNQNSSSTELEPVTQGPHPAVHPNADSPAPHTPVLPDESALPDANPATDQLTEDHTEAVHDSESTLDPAHHPEPALPVYRNHSVSPPFPGPRPFTSRREERLYVGRKSYFGPGWRARFGRLTMQDDLGRLLAALLAVAIILGVVIAASVGFTGSVDNAYTRTFSFAVTNRPVLIINDDAGAVHIHAVDHGPIKIQTTEYASGIGTRMKHTSVHSNQDGNVVRFDASIPFDFLFTGSRRIDLDVTAPVNTDLDIHTLSGAINVDGIQGQLKLVADAGNIIATNVTGHLFLQTTDGPITLKNMSGQAMLSAGSGEIYVSESNLSGQSALSTSEGSVIFAGSLDRHGHYQFSANNGSIDLTLPAQTPFHLISSPDSGPVNNDFGQETMGLAPWAMLNVNVQSGSVSLHKS